MAYLIVSTAAMAVLTGLLTRRLLDRGPTGVSIDRGLLVFVACSLAIALSPMMMAPLVVAAVSIGPDGAIGRLQLLLVVVAVFVAGVWAACRLTLWPIARLVGDDRVTIARAWAMMKGMVWPLILSWLVAGLLVGITALAASAQYRLTGALFWLLVSGAASALLAALLAAVSAEVYRARTDPGGELAAAFD